MPTGYFTQAAKYEELADGLREMLTGWNQPGSTVWKRGKRPPRTAYLSSNQQLPIPLDI
jgi:hypothetical protein